MFRPLLFFPCTCALLLLAGACSDEASTGGNGGNGDVNTCTDLTDCDPGEVCEGGVCVNRSCTGDADCTGDALCLQGQCRAFACAANTDCPELHACEQGRCQPQSCNIDPATAAACYEGPADTAGVGACRLGVWGCNDAGFFECTGAVEPGGESCNGLDDDCDGETDEVPEESCEIEPCGTCCTGTLRCEGGATTCVANEPGEHELCGNGLDDDCDGEIDTGGGCLDPTLWRCTNPDDGAAQCEDLDECAENNGGCGDASAWTCVNNEGAAPTCTDRDECALPAGEGPCHADADCSNTEGGFECTCRGELQGDGLAAGSGCQAKLSCDDITCDPLAPCSEGEQGPRCGTCPPGYADVNGNGTSCRRLPIPGVIDTDIGFNHFVIDGGVEDRELGWRNADDYGQSFEQGFGGPSLVLADFNGDGKADLAVGSPRSDGPNRTVEEPCGAEHRNRGGAVYVFFGREPGNPPARVSTADADVTIFGVCDTDRLGGALAAGDFDGDGTPDLAVGAHDGDYLDPEGGRRNNVGMVYIFRGQKLTAGATLDLESTTASWTIAGNEGSDGLGGALVVGDFNGDDIDDLVAGAKGRDLSGSSGVGAAWLFNGSRGWSEGRVTDLESGGFNAVFVGTRSGDNFGAWLAAGDTDGDGKDDLLVGAAEADRNIPGGDGSQFGAAYLWLGRDFTGQYQAYDAELERPSPAPPNPQDIILWNHLQRGGESALIADLDGDDRAEIVTGWAEAYAPGTTQRHGVLRIWRGRNWMGGEILDVAQDPNAPDVSIASENPFAELGNALATGDIDNDGVADLLAGAGDFDAVTRSDSGGAFLWWGGSPELLAEQGPRIDTSTAAFRAYAGPGEHAGRGLASGDFNGDGWDDIVMAAPGTRISSSSRGRVHIFLGGGRP